MNLKSFTLLVKEIAATLGNEPGGAEVRASLAALGPKPAMADVKDAIDRLGRFLVAAGRTADASRLSSAMSELFVLEKLPDWAKGMGSASPAPMHRSVVADAEPQPKDVTAVRPPSPVVSNWGPVLIGSDPFSVAANAVEQAMLRVRLADARDHFPAALANARVPDHFARLFRMVGPIFENWARTEAWLQVRESMAAHATTFSGDGLRVAASVELRICLALRDYAGFASNYPRFAAMNSRTRDDEVLRAISAKLFGRSFPDFTAEKIIGIGLPKSGTTSFTEALRILGYDVLHLSNPATNDLFCDDDIFLFDGFADLPLCEHFEQYYYALPNAKFVYTTRPYASWKRSFLAEVNARSENAYEGIKGRLLRGEGALWGNRLAYKALSVLGTGTSLQEAHDNYDRRVRTFFADKPPGRFMEFNLALGHGWNELTSFTKRPMPTVPYPHKNPQTRIVQPVKAVAAT